MRLGERLVQEGLITADQLATALRTQAQYGGRIGSLLVEYGSVSVDQVALALAKKLGVPAALQKHFDAMDPSAPRLLPAKAAARLHAVPLGWSTRQAKTLIVAFRDPHDLHAIDEVAVLVRARIQPCVAPEIRLRAALEKHYGIRARSDTAGFVRFDPTTARGVAESEPPPPPPPPPSPTAVSTGNRRATGRMILSMPPPSLASPEPPPVSNERPVAKPAPLRSTLTLEAAVAALAAATERDRVGDVLSEFLARHLRVGLVLIVRDGAAFGWKGFAPSLERDLVESVAVPLGSPSFLKIAHDTRRPFVGALSSEGATVHARLYKQLRCEPPDAAVVVPVVVGTRVVNLLYGHGERGVPLDADAVPQIVQIASAAAEAYARIVRARAAG